MLKLINSWWYIFKKPKQLIHSLWSVSGNQLILKLANKGIKVKNQVFILPFLYKSKTSEKPKSWLGKFFFFEVFPLINEERIIGRKKRMTELEWISPFCQHLSNHHPWLLTTQKETSGHHRPSDRRTQPHLGSTMLSKQGADSVQAFRVVPTSKQPLHIWNVVAHVNYYVLWV